MAFGARTGRACRVSYSVSNVAGKQAPLKGLYSMSKNAPLFEDILSLGGSLLGNLVEARHQIKAQARGGVDTIARRLDLVSRDEFDAAFAMLQKARAAQDEIIDRLEIIEAAMGMKSSAKGGKASRGSLPSVKQGKNRGGKKTARKSA